MEDKCPHCPHPTHRGICGVMDVVEGDFGPAKWGCQCRVETPIPDSFKEGWIRTHSGKKFHFFNPSVEEICLEDIAHHLAQKVRFQGAVSEYYSIASHSIIGALYILEDRKDPRIAKAFLLHDAEEAYFPDVPAPMKHSIPWWRDAVKRTEEVICWALQLDHSLLSDPLVKQIDLMMVDEEGSLLVEGREREWTEGEFHPLRRRLNSHLRAGDHQPNYWRSVKYEYIRLFNRINEEIKRCP